MTTHDLKSWPDFFEPILTGAKKFELRINDRKFNVGDVLLLREFDDRTHAYTGRQIRKRVTYMLDGIGGGAIAPLAGLNMKYCIMSLADEFTQPEYTQPETNDRSPS